MSIQRAIQVQLRKSLEMAEALKQAGIRFVPIPVRDDREFEIFSSILLGRLDTIEKLLEQEGENK